LQGALPASATTWNLHTTQPNYFALTYSEVINLTGFAKNKGLDPIRRSVASMPRSDHFSFLFLANKILSEFAILGRFCMHTPQLEKADVNGNRFYFEHSKYFIFPTTTPI
jgi:hypothetical protein